MPSFRTDGRTGGCAQRAHGLAGDAGREPGVTVGTVDAALDYLRGLEAEAYLEE